MKTLTEQIEEMKTQAVPNLSGADLYGANLYGANLSGAKIRINNRSVVIQ